MLEPQGSRLTMQIFRGHGEDMKIGIMIVAILLLLSSCACSSSSIIYSSKTTDFLICDFNQDGIPEKKFIEEETNSNEQYLIIQQDKKLFLRIPYHSNYKEPYFNTQLAIIYGEGKQRFPRPRLMVKGGRKKELLFYEFHGDNMQQVVPTTREQDAFK